MGKALLFTGGEGPSREECAPFLRDCAIIGACDSGYDLARSWDLMPSFVVGDMDSIRDTRVLDSMPPPSVLRYDSDKDESDTELGIKTLKGMGYEQVIVVGGGGGRLDHLIANLYLFNNKEIAPMLWLPGKEIVWLIDDRWEASLAPGATISVFPLADMPSGMTSEGLKWALEGVVWVPGACGLSNVATDSKVVIGCEGGRLIAIHALDDWRGY